MKVVQGTAKSGHNVQIREVSRDDQYGRGGWCESIQQGTAEKEAG